MIGTSRRWIIVTLLGWAAIGFGVGVALVGFLPIGVIADASSPGVSSQHSSSGADGRVFASDAGLILNFIKPEKVRDFETVIARLKAALQRSQTPERKAQAAGWKVFRAVEPAGNGSVLYIFTMNPAVKGADYTVSRILAESFPDEAQALYKLYAESFAGGQNVVSLTSIVSFENEPTR